MHEKKIPFLNAASKEEYVGCLQRIMVWSTGITIINILAPELYF